MPRTILHSAKLARLAGIFSAPEWLLEIEAIAVTAA